LNVDERLHKLLARHGIGSLRQAEDWIRAGRVTVNGRLAELGQRVGPADRVAVDGRDVSRRLSARSSLRVIICHKPGGEMTRGREGDDRSTVETRLPSLRAGRWLPVNALGFGEEGLLVLSNDGALAGAIARSDGALPVEYRVRVLRPRSGDEWPQVPREVDLDGETAVFDVVERLDGAATNVWFRVVSERPQRRGAVRALFDRAGLKVSRLMLVRWGPLELPRDLPRGRTREVKAADLDAVLTLAGRIPPQESGPAGRGRSQAPAGKHKRRTSGRVPGGRTTGRRSGGR
jgi:23S rRNA pseudouridine2605 synthase